MALPKIEAPKYTCTLPLSGKKVNYRPFLSQEERILLMASETRDPASYIMAIKDVISACTYGAINVDEMASIDMEYLFLTMRTKAVGESVSAIRECSFCKKPIEIVINLEDVKFEFVEEYKTNKKIDVDGNVGIILKTPSPEFITSIEGSGMTQAERMYALIKESLETIYDSEQTYKASDYTETELGEFIDQLPVPVMQKIAKFFEEQPRMVYSNNFECKACKKGNEIKFEGLADFFT